MMGTASVLVVDWLPTGQSRAIDACSHNMITENKLLLVQAHKAQG
jgi:hypothetical protein